MIDQLVNQTSEALHQGMQQQSTDTAGIPIPQDELIPTQQAAPVQQPAPVQEQKIETPVEQPKEEPKNVPEELDNPEIDVFGGSTAGGVQPKDVTVDSVLDAISETQTADDAQDRMTNTDKIGLSIPLSGVEDIDRFRSDEILKHREDIQSIMNDATSNLQVASDALLNLTANRDLGEESLKRLGDHPEEKLRDSISGLGDSQVVLNNYKGKKFSLDGASGYARLTALTGGMRRIFLWNSGFYVTLKNQTLMNLNNFYREVARQDYEYGREAGGYYYLYSHLDIAEFVVKTLLSNAICGSNYVFWQDQDKLLRAISLADFQVLLWGMATLMHPSGARTNFVCAEPECGHIQTEFVDLTKLHLLNTDLITDDMINYFKQNNKVDDAQLADYQNRLLKHLKKDIEFEYGAGTSLKKWIVHCKQCSLYDWLEVGRDFNGELIKSVNIKRNAAVQEYLGYNIYRTFKPWIESVDLHLNIGGEESIGTIENTGTTDNNKSFTMILDEWQQHARDIDLKFRDYILDTSISRLAYYMPECPKCHKAPKTGSHGYVPYDPLRSFFILAFMRLLQATSQSDSQNT